MIIYYHHTRRRRKRETEVAMNLDSGNHPTSLYFTFLGVTRLHCASAEERICPLQTFSQGYERERGRERGVSASKIGIS